MTTKRFWSWELTGAGRVQGVLPIPDGQQPADYTELELDHEQLSQIREHFEGYDKPLVRKPTFDARKRLQHSDYTDPTTGLSGRNMYEYDARGFLCARQELDPKGKLRFRILVSCDDQGRIVEEKISDHAGRQTERHTYQYDGKGRVLEDVKYRAQETKPEGVYKRTWDDQGRVLSNGYYGADGAPLNIYLYTWDAKNRRTQIALTHGSKPTFVTKFTYDEQGHKVSAEHLDGDGHAFARTTAGPNGKSELWVAPPSSVGPRTQALIEGKSLRELSNVTPDQMNALSMLAYASFEEGRFDQARRMYEALSTFASDDPSYPAGVAVAYLSLGDPAQASAWYDRALARAPAHVPSLLGKGEVLLQSGHVQEGLELFRKAFANARPKDDAAVRRAKLIATAISPAATKK